MNKMNIKLINMVVTNLVALTGERTTSSFIMSSRRFLCESFFKGFASDRERVGKTGEKDGDVIIKICDKGLCVSHCGSKPSTELFTACTELRDLHDVVAQKARHKARRKRKKKTWLIESSNFLDVNSQNAPVVSCACNVSVSNRRGTNIMTRTLCTFYLSFERDIYFAFLNKL